VQVLWLSSDQLWCGVVPTIFQGSGGSTRYVYKKKQVICCSSAIPSEVIAWSMPKHLAEASQVFKALFPACTNPASLLSDLCACVCRLHMHMQGRRSHVQELMCPLRQSTSQGWSSSCRYRGTAGSMCCGPPVLHVLLGLLSSLLVAIITAS
jgi:hypothetical protein